jgi:hypothetical protein
MTTGRDKALAAGLGAGAGALAALALRQKVAATGELIIPQELLDAIVSMELTQENILAALNYLAQVISGTGLGNLQNAPKILCFTIYPPVVGVAEQLQEFYVPYDQQLVIKALPNNVGIIRVGNSQAEAQNPNSSYPLIANEAIGYKIYKTNQLWLTCTVAGEGAICTVEQTGGG